MVSSKWEYSHRRGPGRPRVMKDIVDLILRMAQDNPSWGYTRIKGALANLGHEVGRGTIANILKEHGIEPAPERDKHTSWSSFLRAHWDCLCATDFLTVEVFTLTGLVTHYVLFFIDIATRSVHIAGTTTNPGTPWMMQVARNLTDIDDGFLRGKRYLILDRDTKYSDAFRSFLVRDGIKIIRLPPRSPNLNAFAERFVRSIKEECLSRMIFFGQASLRHAVKNYMAHYHLERNHQGLGNRLLQPISAPALLNRPIKQRQRLGGLLNYYYCEAA
jgi:putative transposase